MLFYCKCGSSIAAMEKIKIAEYQFFYCKRCNIYYNAKAEKISRENINVLKEKAENDYPFIRNNSLKSEGEFIHYFYYYPTDENTEKRKRFRKHILNIKEYKEYAMQYAFPKFNNVIKKENHFMICVIPSSKQGLQETPMRTIARSLCTFNRTSGLSCVFRKYTVQKKHDGGPRNLEEEIKSLGTNNHNLIEDRVIVLLDDITTTGTSMLACEELLLSAGAKKVYGLAVAKTSNW